LSPSAVVKPCQRSKVKLAWFSPVANAVTQPRTFGYGDSLMELRGQSFFHFVVAGDIRFFALQPYGLALIVTQNRM
jgi:hypothetical protein